MSRKSQSRVKGSGTIVRHGRVYQARWYIDGKLYTRSTGTSDRREALRILEEIVKPYQAKTDADRARNLSMIAEGKDAEIRSYIDDLPALGIMSGFSAFMKTEEGKKPSPETRYMYECQYFRFADWLKQHHPEIKELRAVSKTIARDFGEYLSRRFSPNTRKKYLSLLAQIWTAIKAQEEDDLEGTQRAIPSAAEAAQLARLEGNPWERIRNQTKTSPADSVRRRDLTLEEIGRIIDSLSGEMRLLFIVGCYTGARLEDCALLDWGQVDLFKQTITIVHRKTKKKNPEPKIIPMSRALLGELFQIPEKNRRGYVLPSIAERYKKDTSNLSSSIQLVFIKNGIQTQLKEDGKRARTIVGFHSLRHFFATFIKEHGQEGQSEYLCGWTNYTMSAHYNHPRQIALRKTIDALPDLTKGEIIKPQPNGSGAILDGICAQLDKLSEDDLSRIAEYISGIINKNNK